MRIIPLLPQIICRFPAVLPIGAAALLFTVLAATFSTLSAGPPQTPAAVEQSPPPAPKASKFQLAQAWIRDLFGTGIAPGLPDRAPPRGEMFPDSDDRPEPRERPAPFSGNYRTVCVRLCDGFYFPVSFSTSRAHFAKDAKRCEESCPNAGRLFVHPTGVNDEPAHMTDLQGKPYAGLENAYRSQKEYVPTCTCRGNPWDAQEIARHQAYKDTAKKPMADAAKTRAASMRSPPQRGGTVAERRMRDED